MLHCRAIPAVSKQFTMQAAALLVSHVNCAVSIASLSCKLDPAHLPWLLLLLLNGCCYVLCLSTSSATPNQKQEALPQCI